MTDLDWTPLGESWWREAQQQVQASNEQTRLACLLFRGDMSQHVAAAEAGYSINLESDDGRASASHACNSKRVKELLALAESENVEPDGSLKHKPVMDAHERLKILTDLGRNARDPAVKIRALDQLEKSEQRRQSFGHAPDTDGLSEWRLVRDFLLMKNGGPAVLHLWHGMGHILPHLPLLHDVYDAVRKSADPGLWDRYAKSYSADTRKWLNQLMANPKYQFEDRVQVWREIGIEITEGKTHAVAANGNGRAQPDSST